MNSLRYMLVRMRIYASYVLDLRPSERRGVIMLLMILVVIDLFHFIDIKRNLPEEESALLTRYVVELHEEKAFLEPMVPFMPDTVSEAALRQWGWPEKLASNLLNYRRKAQFFRSEDQIRSLYGMTDSLFSVIQPFLVFKAQPADQEKGEPIRSRQEYRCPDPMDINMADSVMLSRLHGIGKVLSNRIIAYRELLGGFVSVDQLNEVYGLKKDVIEHISDRLYVDSLFVPMKIPYREGTYQQLYSHPYLDSKQAVFLIRYRQQHGTRGLLEGLEANPRFKKKEIERLRPYLPLSADSGLYR
jgi:competence protein ComEA